MTPLVHDLSFALRGLVRRPAFTLVAVLTLTLAIGANTAIFSVVKAVLLDPLPFERPEELAVVWGFKEEIGRETASYPDFLDWREQNEVFTDLAALYRSATILTGSGEPERLIAAEVSDALFPLLGVEAVAGRLFLPGEDAPGGERLVLLEHGFWQRRFGGDEGVVGRPLVLDGEPHTVVGVLPPTLRLPRQADLFRPLDLEPMPDARRSDFLLVLGRLRSGVSLGEAQTAMSTIAARLEAEYPDTNTGWGVELVPLDEEMTGSVRPMLWTLWGAVSLVLLIACSNVANLLLVRSVGRGEIAVRAALGAGRLRLLRQLLTESAALFLLGGAGGVALGALLIRWVSELELVAVALPQPVDLALDLPVTAFALALALATGLLFGLVPAVATLRQNLVAQLQDGGTRSAGGRGSRRWRGGLVVAQLALALVLLAGAGLLIRSLFELLRVDPGFDPEKVLTTGLTLPAGKYPQAAQRVGFYEDLIERVEALPGVESAAAISGLYIAGGAPELAFLIEGEPPPALGEVIDAQVRTVTPGLYTTLRIPLVAGEPLGPEHGPEGSPVVLVNQTFAARYFPGGSPIGRRIALNQLANGDPDWRLILGVVGDVRQEGFSVPTDPEIQVPLAQTDRRSMQLAVRTAGDPAGLTTAVREVVWAMDPDLPLARVAPLAELLDESLGRERLAMGLLSAFALVALLLAAVGIYSVMAYAVRQRTREIGVRMSMGARPADILRLMVRQGMALIVLGLGVGLGAALWGTGYLASLLYGVGPRDPLSLGAVAALLAAVALVACYLPSRRATRVDPVAAVRYE